MVSRSAHPAPTRRLGGRSARVREVVCEATLALLEDGVGAASVPQVAGRAGVAPSSIYRRWGSWEGLVADAFLMSSQSAITVPDTGTLRQDLIDYATSVAQYLDSPRGHAVARAAVTAGASPELDHHRRQFWTERFQAASGMVERGRSRGEVAPETEGRMLLEMVVAPLHFRRLVSHEDVMAEIEARVDLLLRAPVKPR